MAPYEALYGRRCRSPICWEEVGERKLTGAEIIQVTSKKVPLIKQRLNTTFSRQKSYADPKRKDIEFQVGDYVFLKVSPMKGVIRFGKKGKLSPRYVDPSRIVQPQTAEVSEELTYEEKPVEIVDSQVRKLRTKEIPMVKVLWRNHSVEECTWETEDSMRQRYPYLFDPGKIRV
ncbi:uncharacterized protein LOC126681805 [Mercurialis annua]|uniref:uncharacterized protein LOC126681805 n=1 Tax=Mercurialis annua TaxID=3986 RepID=UPI00215E95D3|nr:uncharacterized protein LOC126681805 [Mercurialis annua]